MNGTAFSGSQLKFVENVTKIRVHPIGPDGEITGSTMDFDPSDVDVCVPGEDGRVHTATHQVFYGVVELFHDDEAAFKDFPPNKLEQIISEMHPNLTLPGPGGLTGAEAIAKAQEQREHLEQRVGSTLQHSVPGGFAEQIRQTVVNRGSDYGTPADNHQLTAELWTLWLSRRLGYRDLLLTAEDVCMLNVLQKAGRLVQVSKDDSWLDIAGYTENVAMLREDQRNR